MFDLMTSAQIAVSTYFTPLPQGCLNVGFGMALAKCQT